MANARVDSNDKLIMIDKRDKRILNVFNQDHKISGIQFGFFFEDDNRMAVMTEKEVFFWVLKPTKCTLQLQHDISDAVLFKYKPNLVFLHVKKGFVYVIESLSLQIFEIYEIPNSVRDFNFVWGNIVCFVQEVDSTFHLKICELEKIKMAFEDNESLFSNRTKFKLFKIQKDSYSSERVIFKVILFMSSVEIRTFDLNISGGEFSLESNAKLQFNVEDSVNTFHDNHKKIWSKKTAFSSFKINSKTSTENLLKKRQRNTKESRTK